jgi:hypothetical protein
VIFEITADFSEKAKNGHRRMKSKNEALTYMDSLTAESKLSSANLSTSVTLRVIHSSMPKIASQENIKNTSIPIF